MIKVLELFGGIGACSKALERLGIDYELADYVEIDKFAVASFNAIHGTDFKPQDICQWDKKIDVDLIMHGSPCQDISICGKELGADEKSGTRSSLMYETIRIVKSLRPKYVIWENVKNLLSKNHIHNFNNYINKLEQLGYNSYYQVLNSKDYGIPQSRERVFTVSIRKDIDKGSFLFPEKQELKLRLKDILEDNVDEKFYLTDYQIEKIKHAKFRQDRACIHNVTDISHTLTVKSHTKCVVVGELKGGKYDKLFKVCRRVYSPLGLSPTLTACCGGGQEKKVSENERVRKLTPKEYWRLMGFDDSDFIKASKVCSNHQLYKQAGNSIVVNVLEKILSNLLRE